MTYKRCAFLSNDTDVRRVLGSYAYVRKCTRPGRRIQDACLPSHPRYPGMGKDIGDICPFFRGKSVMNSFGAGKEDGDGQMHT